ncbi:hypothetical protein DH2020_001334 [Rehmannia glutinosa]|uniref:Uncharacterized protein n=1 Tax=Rehmannia glutinosa TaxID=99300 RepID=A0ABR0XZ27_REHGL
MRRAYPKLLFHFQKPKTPISLISRDFSSTFDHPLPRPSKTHLNKSCSGTQYLLFTNFNSQGFRASPSQSFNTLADPIAQNASQLSSRQRKIKERSDLEEAFESAESIDEMLEAFKVMETCFDEKDLGLACLKIGLKLDQQGEDPEKALSFAQRALRILDDNDNSDSNSGTRLSLPIAMTLQLLGSSSFTLKRFNDSLGYLNRANRVLSKLEGESSYRAEQVLPILHAVQFELFNVKTAVGRREEALAHLRKALEIKEKTLEEDSKELGKANRDVAEAYVAVLNFNEALPFCLKALEIHKRQLGHNSVEVAYDRKLLGVIYTGLEEHEKALEQNQLSRRVLKNWGRSSDLLRAEIDAANMQIALGRHEEAINTLKGVVQQTDKESEDRAMVFTSMAKALCNQDKFADAKRTLAMVEKLPQEQHSVGSVSARIGWLLLLTAKVEQAIPYLEDAAERLKESFGSKHYGVDRPQSAAQVFAYAKDIMDVALGPHHMDSIEACQNLSKAYAAMKRFGGHGPTAQDELDEAVRVLDELKEKATVAVSEALFKALPLPHNDDTFSANNSQSGNSAMAR